MLEVNYGDWKAYFQSRYEFYQWMSEVNRLLCAQGKDQMDECDFTFYQYCPHEEPKDFLIIKERIDRGIIY